MSQFSFTLCIAESNIELGKHLFDLDHMFSRKECW